MKNIKLFDPNIGKLEEDAVLDTLYSKFWASGAGTKKTEKFEQKFNKYIDSKECVSVNSGTAALHLALSMCEIKGKEVILPSLSFVSTAHSIIYNGGKPVFVDVDPNTLCIDPKLVEEKINEKTVAILPVHFGGMPANLEQIQKLTKKHKIHLIEDAAHAAGTTYNQKKIGSHGELVCFSFHPVKNLAMPNGGAICINSKKSKQIKKILNSKRWCGISNRNDSKYDVPDIGWNYYLNEFSAAIGIEQLKKLDKMNLIKKKIAKRYSNELNVFQKMPFSKDCSFHIFWIRIKKRDEFRKKMKLDGIETGIHYQPIHKMKYYDTKIKLKITEKVSEEIVSLPIHPNLSEIEINKIIKFTNKYA